MRSGQRHGRIGQRGHDAWRSGGSAYFGDQIAIEEFVTQTVQQSRVDSTAVFKADLDFRRVDIDIHRLRIHLDVKETNWHTADHEQAPIGFA